MGYESETKQKKAVYQNDEFDVELIKTNPYQEHLKKSWQEKETNSKRKTKQNILTKLSDLARVVRIRITDKIKSLNKPDSKQLRKVLPVGVAVLVVVVLMNAVFFNSKPTPRTEDLSGVLGLSNEQVQNLLDSQSSEINTLPNTTVDLGETITNQNDLSGIYSTTSSIYGTEVRVTFQKTPAGYGEQDNGIEKLALSLDKKTSINQLETEKGVVYLVTFEDNTQTAIFTYQDYLYFITSKFVISNPVWVNYLNEL